jgi:TetR/AcrR family transcriptional regulator, transcriptional repressor for nem operon
MPRPRTFDEDDVVAAARDAFWSGGYAGTSLDDLTSATGLGKGSLYGAFGDKHALFMRTLEGYCDSTIDTVRQQLAGPVDGAYQRLVDSVRLIVMMITADTSLRGCMLAKSAAELAGTDTQVREKVRHTLTAIHADIARTVADAQQEGMLAPDADADQLASLLLAVLRGIEALHKSAVDDDIVAGAAEQVLALLPRAE